MPETVLRGSWVPDVALAEAEDGACGWHGRPASLGLIGGRSGGMSWAAGERTAKHAHTVSISSKARRRDQAKRAKHFPQQPPQPPLSLHRPPPHSPGIQFQRSPCVPRAQYLRASKDAGHLHKVMARRTVSRDHHVQRRRTDSHLDRRQNSSWAAKAIVRVHNQGKAVATCLQTIQWCYGASFSLQLSVAYTSGTKASQVMPRESSRLP